MGTATKTASVRTLPQVLPRVHKEDRTATAIIGSHAGSLRSRLTMLGFQTCKSQLGSQTRLTKDRRQPKQIVQVAAVVAVAAALVRRQFTHQLPRWCPSRQDEQLLDSLNVQSAFSI